MAASRAAASRTEASTLAEALTDLRRPFTPAAVKFKPLTKPRDGKSSAAFYIDARLVAERLNEVVGPENWSDDYALITEGREAPALYYPVVCRLTVCGVTKSDVGQGANTVVDEKAWKSAYSDALKRAAVKFGIGAYLYVIPRLYAAVDVGQDGKAKGFSKEGKAFLLGKYQGWLVSPLNTFGEPYDHGDVADDDEASSPGGATVAAETRKGSAATPPTTEAETKLLELARQYAVVNPEFSVQTVRDSIKEQQGQPNFAAWLNRGIARMEKNIAEAQAEREALRNFPIPDGAKAA